MIDAALGLATKVPTPAGEVDFEVRAGAQPGEVSMLKGQGMPSLRSSRRGDLYVRLDVAVPKHLTDEQRKLLEEVDAQVGPESYASSDDEDGGFFRRLKSALR